MTQLNSGSISVLWSSPLSLVLSHFIYDLLPVFNQYDDVLKTTAIRICFLGKTSLFSFSNTSCRSKFITTIFVLLIL